MPCSLPPYSSTTVHPLGTILEEKVQEVCRTSIDSNLIKNVFRLLPLPVNAVELLSKRDKRWLNKFLQDICKEHAIAVPRRLTPTSAAQYIVNIATRRKPTLPWTGRRVVINLRDNAIPTTGEILEIEIQNIFSWTIFRDWVPSRFGYQNDFLYKIIRFRDLLLEYAQSYGPTKLESVLEALPSQQPVVQWVLSTAISHDDSSPIDSLRFIIEPIEQLLTEHQHNFPALVQHLLIIEARFRMKVEIATQINWSAPFSMDFSLWQNISTWPAQRVADSITKDVEKLFSGGHGPTRTSWKGITQYWSGFAEDMATCLKADTWVENYAKDLADCLLKTSPPNVCIATAVGYALANSGFQLHKPWATWDIIKPDDNFAGCRGIVHCLPYVDPLSVAGKGQKIDREFLKRIRDGKENTEPAHFELGEQQNTSRRIFETTRDGEENVELVHFEQQSTNRGIFEIIRDGEENTESMHFGLKEQQSTSLGNLRGRQKVENTVQQRTYNGHGHSPNHAEHFSPSSSPIDQYHVHNHSQLKRKAPIDMEQPGTKRVADGFGRHYNRNQQHQNSIVHDPIPFSRNDMNHFAQPIFDGRNSTIACQPPYHISSLPQMANSNPKFSHDLVLPSISLLLNYYKFNIKHLLNPKVVHLGTLKQTSSCIDADAQWVNFAVSKEHYPFSQVSTPPSASNPSLAHIKGSRYFKNAPTLQEDSTVRFESSEKINQDPAQYEYPAELLATPKPSPEKGKIICIDVETAPDEDLELTYPRADDYRISRMCSPLDPPRDARRSGSGQLEDHRLGNQGNHSPTTQIAKPPPLSDDQCSALTDKQCRQIQKLLDPDGTRKQKSWNAKSQPKLIRLWMTGKPISEIAEEMGESWSKKTYSNKFRDWNFPVTRHKRYDVIKELYDVLKGLTQPTAFKAKLPSVTTEESDFVRYSHRDLGETLQQTRSRFRKLFGKAVPNSITDFERVNGITSQARRIIACKMKSRLVDIKPCRASEYPWVESYHKQEIEAKLALSSIILEYLRPFSAEALDFLWFLHFDIGLPMVLLNTFHYETDGVSKAHQADFDRRGIDFSCGYRINHGSPAMREGTTVMTEAYRGKYRLCDINPNAIQYEWIPEIFKLGMRNPQSRSEAFVQFYGLSTQQRIGAMIAQLGGSLAFPGSNDMPQSTFHRKYEYERPQMHVASPEPRQKVCTRSCAGCVSCKGEECDGLQSSSREGMAGASLAAPLSMSADAEEINSENVAVFCPSPSTEDFIEVQLAPGRASNTLNDQVTEPRSVSLLDRDDN
ncbi:hypothetical protein N431DRAFT_557791 [Stipitochalara longipes BDJ]|nr:hypothetical protein N431DRAFT_557791 [Stipitochalara longipes BDJ]